MAKKLSLDPLLLRFLCCNIMTEKKITVILFDKRRMSIAILSAKLTDKYNNTPETTLEVSQGNQPPQIQIHTKK